MMLLTSAGLTKADLVSAAFRFVDFLVRIWLLKACFLLIFPEPVSLNRFLALDFVFCLGISVKLYRSHFISLLWER